MQIRSFKDLCEPCLNAPEIISDFLDISHWHVLWGDGTVDELYEYKNLGVLKNNIGSFSSNVENNIDKTRKKAGMIFSSNFDR